jgi:transcriptional regulatory protein RtcR
MHKKLVVLGFSGSLRLGRNEVWEANADLCRKLEKEGRRVDRYELLYSSREWEEAAGWKPRAAFERALTAIKAVSPNTRVVTRKIVFQDAWDFEKVYLALYDFVEKYPFDTEHEDYLVHLTKGTFVIQTCWFLLMESQIIPGRLAHNSPPSQSYPEGKLAVVDLSLAKYNQIMARHKSHQETAVVVLKKGIATKNERFNKLISEIEHVAVNTTEPMLLLGPTGAGKSELAERIFDLRRGRKIVTGTFCPLNCGTIRGDGAMSALFGHVVGAFTGASKARGGAMRAADKGLLFLDEIGALGIEEQTLLLRALDTKKVCPYGSDEEHTSDFQLIAATNQNLEEAVQNGKFREDLLARIQLWRFELPGLRERPEDIEPNLEYELKRWQKAKRKHVRMSKEVKTKFLRFATSPEAKWTANFRDLRGAVERMAALAEDGIITEQVLADQLDELRKRWRRASAVELGHDAILRSVLGEDEPSKLDLIDRIQLAGVIQVCRKSRTAAEAGKQLFGAPHRVKPNYSDRVTKYLRRFGLQFSDCRSVPPASG